MKISQPKHSTDLLILQIEDVGNIVSQLKDVTRRPCVNCSKACSCSHSVSCKCDCSIACAFIGEHLTSDKDKFPIETKILPIVYTLSEMNVCQTCWSCEGHNDANGNIIKLPQVWFYTNSMMLLRLLSDSMASFSGKGVIYDWKISSAYTARDCEYNAFSLQPDLSFTPNAELLYLQKDIAVIAQELPLTLLKKASDYQKMLTNKLHGLTHE